MWGVGGGGNGGRWGILGSGWVEGTLVKIREVKPVDMCVEGGVDGCHVLVCDNINERSTMGGRRWM